MRFGRPFALAVFVLAAGCNQQQQPALYASSANEPAYAERYPTQLATARTRFAKDEEEAQKLTTDFQKFPDELDKPDWMVVGAVVEEADQAGKGWDYAAGMSEQQAVRDFYEQEKQPLVQKVGGAADYAAKQKKCEDLELYGPVAGGLDRAFDQQLEERVRSRSVAQRTIEDNQDLVGKGNVEKLEKQADKIALASHLVHVRMPQTKRDIDAALADASEVKKTLERTKERAAVVESNPQASRSAKQLAQKRASAASAAEAQLDSEVAEAKKLSEQIEQRASAAQKNYETALETLKNAVKQRAEAGAKK
ncbi:MAG TPA: hypothetical protein VGK73_27315 [Polyangiaceae bacterium]